MARTARASFSGWLATDSHALLETTSVLTQIPMLRT